MIRTVTETRPVERDGITYVVVRGTGLVNFIDRPTWQQEIVALERVPDEAVTYVGDSWLVRGWNIPTELYSEHAGKYGHVWTRYLPGRPSDRDADSFNDAARALSISLIEAAFPHEYASWERVKGIGDAPTGYLRGEEMPDSIALVFASLGLATDGGEREAAERLSANLTERTYPPHTRALLKLLVAALQAGDVAMQIQIATLYGEP